MSEKSNDSIEEFFKKAVRQSDITFRESDWQKMEKMLDEKAMGGSASTSRPWKRIVGVVVIAALLSSLLFLIPDNDQTSGQENQSITKKGENKNTAVNDLSPVTNADASTNDLPPYESLRSETSATSSNTTDASSSIDATRSSASGQSPVQNKSAAGDRETTNSSTSIRAGKDNPETSAEIKTSGANSNAISKKGGISRVETIANVASAKAKSDQQEKAHAIPSQKLVAGTVVDRDERRNDQNPDNESKESIAQPSKEQTQQQSDIEAAQTSPSDQSKVNTTNVSKDAEALSKTSTGRAVLNDSVEEVKEEDQRSEPASTNSDEQKDNNDKTITPSRWSVALVVAPEFSSTSFDKQTSPGSAYGLMIGYRILNRITITTGVVKTHKKYVGYGEDYQPPAGYWQYRTNGIVPDEVSGQCSVYEFPLMLQYDLLPRDKWRLFAAGGVSSYRMMNEKYAYTFNEPNDGAADGWATDTPSSYYFSVGHLSLGYERQLYRGLHAGIEPYVKLPFGGIGWSNVNLLTMGAYFNVRYKFSKRN